MCRLSPPSPPPRPRSTVSIAASDTTYHSFRDVHLTEPNSPRKHKKQASEPSPPAPHEMQRQDSGYESMASPQHSPRGSLSQQRRRTSTTPSMPSSTCRQRPRPTTRRSTRSERAGHISRISVHSPSSSVSRRQHRSWDDHSYFHFPHFPCPSQDQSPRTDLDYSTPSSPLTTQFTHPDDLPPADLPAHPVPPPTTHYWTSDQTRRLEYAAIDAASKGVRGWVMRHMVPDCFIPRSQRHLRFDDDSGSVVRYRLSLEMEDEARKEEDTNQDKKRRGWWVSILPKS